MSKVVHRKDIQRNILMYLSRKFNHSLTVPDRVSVNLTLRCNLKCIMCTTYAYFLSRTLTTRDLFHH